MPIEPGASWFSPKYVEAERLVLQQGGKATVSVRAARAVPNRDEL